VAVIQIVGGTVELVGAGALALAPEPTGATKVGAVVLGVHGADTVAAGVRTLTSGEIQETFTQQAAEAGAEALGASPGVAEGVGIVVDIGASAGPALTVAFTRRAAAEGLEAGVERLAIEAGEQTIDLSTTFRGERFREIALQPGTRLERAFEEGATAPVGSFTVRAGGAASRNLTSSEAAVIELALGETSGAVPTHVSLLEVTAGTGARIGFIEGGGKNAIQIVVENPRVLREVGRRSLPRR
jgi:hypothetical protein